MLILKIIIISLIPLALFGGLAGYLFACLRKKNLFDPELLPEDSPRTVYLRQCSAGYKALKDMDGVPLILRSKDGKKLRATLYANGQKERFVILVHGYHSSPAYDFGTIAHFYMALGYGVLLVTQRAHGDSEGMLITYGAKEAEDVCRWAVDLSTMYPDSRIMLHGISMGGATVMLAGEKALPKNVTALINDCGYTTPFEEIAHVAKTSMHLPRFTVHLADLWAMMLTGVSLKKPSVTRAGSRCLLPKLYIHGEDDSFVPYEMGVRNFKEAAEPKRFVSVPGAGHALAFFIDEKRVSKEIARFADENLG